MNVNEVSERAFVRSELLVYICVYITSVFSSQVFVGIACDNNIFDQIINSYVFQKIFPSGSQDENKVKRG